MVSLLIPVLAMTAYGQFFTSRVLTQEALERSQYEVHLQAQNFVLSLERVQSDAFYLSALRSFRQFRQAHDEQAPDNEVALWRSEAERDFLVFTSVKTMYFRVRYVDGSGDEIIGINSDDSSVYAVPETDHVNLSDENYFQRTMALDDNRVFVSFFFLNTAGESGGMPLFRYAVKLPDQDGILTFDIFASWMLRNMPLTGSGDTWGLVNQDGHHLLYPFVEENNGALEGTINEADAIIADNMDDLLGSNNGTFETASSVYLFSRIYPSASSADSFWILYREIPKADLYAAVDNFYLASVLVIILAVVVAFVLAFLISGQITRPLLDLKRKAEDFARGSTLPPAPHPLPLYELGDLTLAFHKMADDLEAERHQKRILINKLINAQEEERKFIAYDLHDGLIQQMVGARLYFSTLQTREDLDDPEFLSQLQKGCDILSHAITEGRQIIEGLHPNTLDDLGLVESISEMADQLACTHQWDLNLHLVELPRTPDRTVSVTVYRIAQEALNNICKHANASNVRLSLTNGHHINLTIEDDGRGFDLASINGGKGGLGLTTMRERAGLLNGECIIESQPGKGTRIAITVPYVASDAYGPAL